jgi:hypothetical protein
MRKTKFGLIIALILLAIFIFKNDKETSPHSIKTVTLTNTDKTKSNQDNKTKKTKPQPLSSIEENKEKNAQENIYIDLKLNYLTAFRNYQYLLECDRIYYKSERERPQDKFFNRQVREHQKYGNTGVEEHLFHFNKFSDICLDLLDTDNETFDQAKSRLVKTYQSIEPISKQEKELSLFITLIESLSQFADQLYILRKGFSNLTKDERLKIDHENLILRQSLSSYTSIPIKNRTQEQITKILVIHSSIDQLNKQVSDSYVKDKRQINKLKVKHDSLIEEIISLLKSTSSPDIFMLLHYARDDFTNKDGYFIVKKLILQKIQKLIELIDDDFIDQYITILSDYALPLFACSLNYPCDKNSQLIFFHCVKKANKNACGRTVDGFYLDQLISPNVLEDVSIVLANLNENFAHE